MSSMPTDSRTKDSGMPAACMQWQMVDITSHANTQVCTENAAAAYLSSLKRLLWQHTHVCSKAQGGSKIAAYLAALKAYSKVARLCWQGHQGLDSSKRWGDEGQVQMLQGIQMSRHPECGV